MEAVAKHDFKATAEDELSFGKDCKLIIINTEEDQNWFKACCDGKEGLIPNNYIEFKPNNWYLGNIKRVQAEEKLLQKSGGQYVHPDGAFLVRRCESQPNEFSLSVKFRDAVQHFKILKDNCGKYFLWVTKFSSINELIDYHRSVSVNRQQTIYLRDMAGKKKVQAQYDFDPQEEGELKLSRGDALEVTGELDRHWWKGKNLKTNQEGVFPANYVKEM